MDNRINPNQLGQLGNIGGALPTGNVNANQGFDFSNSPALLQAPANFGGAQGANGINPMSFQGGQGSGSPMLDLKEMGYQIASLASTLKQQIMNRGQQGSGLQQFSGQIQGIGSPTGTSVDPLTSGTSGQGGAYQAGMDIPGVSSGVENTLGNLSSTLSTANFGETSQWLKQLPQQAEQRQASEGSEGTNEDEGVESSEESNSQESGNEDEEVSGGEETESGSETGNNRNEGENRTESSGGSESTENSSNDNVRNHHNRDSR